MKKELLKNSNEKIEFETYGEKFIVSLFLDGEWSQHGVYETYENALKSIERYYKTKKKNIKPLFCLQESFNRLEEVRITSVDENTRFRGQYVWVTNVQTKRREKKGLSNLIENTKENLHVLDEIKKHETTIKLLRETVTRISSKQVLEHFKLQFSREGS